MYTLKIINIENNNCVNYIFTEEEILNNNILKLLFSTKRYDKEIFFLPYYVTNEVFNKIITCKSNNQMIEIIKNNEIIHINNLNNLTLDSKKFLDLFLYLNNYYEYDSEFVDMEVSKHIVKIYNKWLYNNIQDISKINCEFKKIGDSELSKFWKNIHNKINIHSKIYNYMENFLDRKYIYCENDKEKKLLNKISLILFNNPLFDKDYNYFEYSYNTGRFKSVSRESIDFQNKWEIINFHELNKGDILQKAQITFKPIESNFIEVTSYNKIVYSYAIPNKNLEISEKIGIKIIKDAIKEQKPKGTCFIYANNKQVVSSIKGEYTIPLLVNVSSSLNDGDVIKVVCLNTGKGALTKYYYYKELSSCDNNKLFPLLEGSL